MYITNVSPEGSMYTADIACEGCMYASQVSLVFNIYNADMPKSVAIL